MGAMFIGLFSSLICYVSVAYIKPKLGYDDALDAFGVHGVGGFVGAILTGVFATKLITGEQEGALYGDWHQLGVQVIVNCAALVFSAVMTYIIFLVVDKTVGVRVTSRVEEEGLDIYEHGEMAYN